MQNQLIALIIAKFLILISFNISIQTQGQNTLSKDWLLPKIATQMLRESEYELTVSGGTGSIGSSKMADQELGYRSSISFVECEKGFIPDLVKKAFSDGFENARKNGLLDGDISCTSAGSEDSPWVSHHWQYMSSSKGIIGPLIVWFPDTKQERMKMIIVVDERRADQ